MELLLIQVQQALMFHETIHMFQFAVWIRSGQKDLPLSTDLLLVCYIVVYVLIVLAIM